MSIWVLTFPPSSGIIITESEERKMPILILKIDLKKKQVIDHYMEIAKDDIIIPEESEGE